jgi:hypothetical protein
MGMTMIAGNIQQVEAELAANSFDLDRREAILRVQRNAITRDLGQIQSDLRLDLLQAKRESGEKLDVTTVLIVEWHQRFLSALSDSEHPQRVFEEFKGLLQPILVDSIFRASLDENALLGNDGETYTEMGLQLFRNMAPAQFQNRSPLHPRVETPLETTPHIYARYMVEWLKRHNTTHRNPQNEIVEEAHRQLKLMANRLPPPEMDQDEVIRQIMGRQAQRQVQREQERNKQIKVSRIKFEDQYKAALVPIVQKGFAQVERRIDQIAQRQLSEAKELNRYISAEINVLQPAIDFVVAEIAELTEREKALERQNNRVQVGIVTLQSTHQQLAVETTQLEKQIKESEKAGFQALGSALLTIGLCAFGSWAIKCVMEAASAGTSGLSVIFKPSPNTFFIQASTKF